MATQDHTVDGTEITPAPWTLPNDISKSDSLASKDAGGMHEQTFLVER